jgi:hypothetical protein
MQGEVDQGCACDLIAGLNRPDLPQDVRDPSNPHDPHSLAELDGFRGVRR